MPGALAATGAWFAANSSWIVPAAAVGGVVGGGISAYNSYQSGKTQERIANYNYLLSQKNAAMQQRMGMAQMQASMAQSRVMEAMAGINKALATSEANARIANADQIRKNAEAQTAVDRANIRSTRVDHMRLLARQRAAAAGSGVLESGSFLDLLSETAGEMQQTLNEEQFVSDLGRRKGYGEAAMEEFGGRLALAGAEANYSGNIAEATFARSAAALEGAKAAAQYSSSMSSARINKLAGMSDAQGLKSAAWGSLISSAGTFGATMGDWGTKFSKNNGINPYATS